MAFRRLFLLLAGMLPIAVAGQETFTLESCLDYAVEHNQSIQKDKLGLETANLARKEVVGSLLPQISASAGITDNIQKTTFAMPNFVNSMMPESMQDPNAAKYMTVTMGMDYSANWGASVAQQVVNFALFNALNIAEQSQKMAELGVDMTTQDVIAQTTLLYYNVQVLEYAMTQFDSSIALLDRTLGILKANMDNGLMRKVDADRVQVSKTNLETQRGSMEQALELQKKLLKLQMGFPMAQEMAVTDLDTDEIEKMLSTTTLQEFSIDRLPAFQMMKQQQGMLELQRKSAVYASLPVITFVGNYSMNYMGDDFKGETFHHFPVSMISLNLKMPIFTGLSNTAKLRKAKVELLKSSHDEQAMTESLNMNWAVASGQLEQQLKTVKAQKENKQLAQDVFDVTEVNFSEGIASLSDLLNAQSQLIQSQMNYVNALNSSVQAYIDLKKADGTVYELKK